MRIYGNPEKFYEKLKICYLTESFYPGVGGQEKHAFLLAQKLNCKGLDLFVITRKLEDNAKEIEEIGNVFIRRITPMGQLKGKGWKALIPVIKMSLYILYFLIKYINKYDIIMISSIKILPIPVILISLLIRKKCVVKIESPIELWENVFMDNMKKMGLKSSILLKLFRAQRNFILKRTDYFIAISSEIKKILTEIGVKPEKIQFIPNGIELDKFYPVSNEERIRLRKKLFLPLQKTIFIFTGRLALSKGVLPLIESFNYLKQKYNNIHLLFVGSGKNSFDDCENELREFIINNKIEQNVSFSGVADNVNEYLMSSNIFIFPK